MDALESHQAVQLDVLRGLIETMRVSQGYMDRDRRKDFKFDGNPVKYDVFVTSYMDKITEEMTAKHKLRIMFGMLGKEAERAFDLRCGPSDDSDEHLGLISEKF